MTEIYNMAGHLVRRLNQISVAIFSENMAAIGIELTPVQFAALSVIRTHPGIDQATLAGMIAYDKATLGGVVDRLAAKRLITRGVSRTDRRARALSITDEGEALHGRILPVVQALQADILSGLDTGERDTLLSLLKKTTDAGNAKSRAPLRKPRVAEPDPAPVSDPPA